MILFPIKKLFDQLIIKPKMTLIINNYRRNSEKQKKEVEKKSGEDFIEQGYTPIYPETNASGVWNKTF